MLPQQGWFRVRPAGGCHQYRLHTRWNGTELVTGKIRDNGARLAVGGDFITSSKATFYNRNLFFS